MTESLSLTAIRREQRRIAALLDASKQLGLVIPGRQDGIPLEHLYKSSYYQQVQAGFRQVCITGTQQTAVSLPHMEHEPKRQGKETDGVWMRDKAKKPTAVLSLRSTKEGWKHLREVREKRESFSKRHQFRTKKIGGDKRLFEDPDGVDGWSPGQAAREILTRKRIRNDKQTNDVIGKKLTEKSSELQSLDLSDRLSNYGSFVDFRLPRLAKPSLPGIVDFVQTDNSPTGLEGHHHTSVSGKPLLRYNHANKGLGVDLSVQPGQPEPEQSNAAVSSYDWSVYSDSPEDLYRPFYPQTPSASPASLGSVEGSDLLSLARELNSNFLLSGGANDCDGNLGQSSNSSRQGGAGSTDCLRTSSGRTSRRMKQDMWGGEGESNSDIAMNRGGLPHHSLQNRHRNGRNFMEFKDPSTSLDSHRDAYVRALAVARSRRLPDDFRALGTRTTRAFSFSYFADHKLACNCLRCLERVQQDSLRKKPAKKKKPPQGLKLILGNVKMEDYYTR